MGLWCEEKPDRNWIGVAISTCTIVDPLGPSSLLEMRHSVWAFQTYHWLQMKENFALRGVVQSALNSKGFELEFQPEGVRRDVFVLLT